MNLSDIPPSLFTIIAEAFGIFVAEKLRFNQQNSIGNFFELFGQVILTYNAQQQLRQQGPGALPSAGLNKELATSSQAQPPSSSVMPMASVASSILPGMAMPYAPPPSEDIELLKQQVTSLTEEVLQLKELILLMQSCMK